MTTPLAATDNGTATFTGTATESERCLPLLTALPGVATVLDTVTTLGLDRVTGLLESAAYLPLWLDLPVAGWQGTVGSFRAEGPARRLILASQPGANGWPVASPHLGAVAAELVSRWELIPEDYDACPGSAPSWRPPFAPTREQRFELSEFTLTLGGASGIRAHGCGRTLGLARAGSRDVRVAAVLNVTEGWGALAGLAGTVVASGVLEAAGRLRLQVLPRMMDPSRELLGSAPASSPASSPAPAGEAPSGVSILAFVGEIDLDHRVTLRCSPSRGLLGSNVYERLRAVELGFTVGAGRASCSGRGLAAWTRPGAAVGSVAAKLNFYPLSIPPVSPISTHQGVFEFRDFAAEPAGRLVGTLHADMTEGRSVRTALPGELLPAFRFGGFGPITGGTGAFAGARGVMTMNSIVSVQPRTLANLYLLALDDPEGRFCVAPQPEGWVA